MDESFYTVAEISLNRIAITLFLIFTLFLGLRVKRAKNLQEYALAGRSLNTGVLTLSLLATFVASGDIFQPYYTAKCGILELREGIFFVMSFLLIGILLAPKMKNFKNCMTAGDIMGKLYGKRAQLITGVIGFGFFLLITSAQMRVLGDLAGKMLDISPARAIIAISLFVILYSAVGGIRSVAITDVFQFITLVVALVVFTNVLLYKIGGLEKLFEKLPAEKLAVKANPEFTHKITTGLFYGLFPTFLLSPPVIQRMLMAKSKKQAKKMFFVSGVFYAVIWTLFALIGLGAWVYYQERGSLENINENLFSNLLRDVFRGSPLVQLFLNLGLICIIISTIDSYIVATSISFVRDFMVFSSEAKKDSLRNKRIAQLLTALAGFFSIGISILLKDPYGEMSYYYTVVLAAIFLVPFVLGVLGMKTTKYSFVSFVVPYIITYFLVTLLLEPDAKYYIFFIALGVGIFSYLAHHYFVNKGFVMIDRISTFFTVKKWRPEGEKRHKKLTKMVRSRSNLAQIARDKVNVYGNEPLLFSLFVLLTNMVVNVTSDNHLLETFYLTGIVQLGGSLLCVGLMLRSLWPKNIRERLFPLYWFFLYSTASPSPTPCYSSMSPATLSALLN